MNTKSKMQISEFSILTGISKDSLRFYDKIGLLSPDLRGENGYRYYTERQIDLAFIIVELRALGIGLEDIKKYSDERSPERMLTFFSEQDKRIESEIEHLRSIQELMRLRSDMVTQALQHEEGIVVIEERKREPIFVCPFFNNESEDADILNLSYSYAADHGVNVTFPYGAIIQRKNLELGDWLSPYRYYFKVRKNQNAWKRAGTYAVFCRSINDGSTDGFYKPLLMFIQKNNLHIVGDIYEEYPLDELSTHEWSRFKIRVEVRVVQSRNELVR